MRSAVAAAIVAVACVGALAACGSDTVDDPRGHTVQVSKVESSPQTVQCRPFAPGDAVAREIDFNVTVVNTRSDTVIVQNISSNAVTVGSHNQALVGQQAWRFTTLPFTPTDAIVRPKDGEVVFTVRMSMVCVPGGLAQPDFIDVDVTLTVRTNIGDFLSLPLRIHQAYL